MKSFRNVNPKSFQEAARSLAADPKAMAVGGGSDLRQLVKEQILKPDTLVNLKAPSVRWPLWMRSATMRMCGRSTRCWPRPRGKWRRRRSAMRAPSRAT